MADALRRITAITIATEVAINKAQNTEVSDEDVAGEWQKRFFEVIRAPSNTPPPYRPPVLGLEDKPPVPTPQGSDSAPKGQQNTGEK